MSARRQQQSAQAGAALAAAMAAAVVGCAGCAAAGAAPAPPRPGKSPAAIALGAGKSPAATAPCPARAVATLPAERWPAARQALAPPGASAIRLCRYSGLNEHPRLALVRARLVRRPAPVRQLVSDFDRLPPATGAVACPNDDGSQILARLAYPGGHAVTIAVGLSGCHPVTNGSVVRTAEGMGTPRADGPQLIARLKRLLAGGARPRRRSRSALAPTDDAAVWTGRQAFVFGQAATNVRSGWRW